MIISDEFRRVIAVSGFFYGRNLGAVHSWCERVAAEAGGSALDVAKFATARRMMLMRDATAARYRAVVDGSRAVERPKDPARYDCRAARQAAPAPKAAKPKPAARKPVRKPLATDWNSVISRYLASKGRAPAADEREEREED